MALKATPGLYSSPPSLLLDSPHLSPPMTDDLLTAFKKTYGKEPNLYELEQFKRNRPVKNPWSINTKVKLDAHQWKDLGGLHPSEKAKLNQATQT